MVDVCERCGYFRVCDRYLEYSGSAVPSDCLMRGEDGWPEKVSDGVVDELRRKI